MRLAAALVLIASLALAQNPQTESGGTHYFPGAVQTGPTKFTSLGLGGYKCTQTQNLGVWVYCKDCAGCGAVCTQDTNAATQGAYAECVNGEWTCFGKGSTCVGGVCVALGGACTTSNQCCEGVCLDGVCTAPTVNVCGVIEKINADDDLFEFFTMPRDTHLLSATCHCQGPCATPPELVFNMRSGVPTVPLTGPLVCDATTSLSPHVPFTGPPAVSADDGLQFSVTNTPDADDTGGLDRIDVCVYYSFP